MDTLLLLIAVVLAAVAAVLYWPNHPAALACIALACFAGAFLVPRIVTRAP